MDPEITVAPGVKRSDHFWGYSLTGSKDALIASGLVKPDWFVRVGLKNKRGHTMRTKRLEIDGRLIESTVPACGHANVRFSYTQEEQDAARDREELRKARVYETAEIAKLPNSHERYRQVTSEIFRQWLGALRNALNRPSGGYHYAYEVLAEFDDAVADIEHALATARTLYDPKERAREIAGFKAKTAKADPALQRFMDQLGISGKEAA